MWIDAIGIIKTGTNANKKEDSTMLTTNNKKAKLTLDEAMTIINNASTENKIEVTLKDSINYVIKIDEHNYVVYLPADKLYLYIYAALAKLNLNKKANRKGTYNFTVVSNSPVALWGAEIDICTNIEDDYYNLYYGIKLNIDILYDMIDTPNKIELDDKKARKMLTKARFTGRLYELFGGYGYTINNNNIIWYIPDDFCTNKNYIWFTPDGFCKNKNDINKKLYHILLDAYYSDGENILDHLDRDKIDKGTNKDEITLNIHVVSNKKIFDTDFILYINDVNKDQKVLAYIHNNIKNDTACQK